MRPGMTGCCYTNWSDVPPHIAGTVPVTDFFAPEHAQRIMAGGGGAPAGA